MINGNKEKASKLTKKMGKLVVVAHPILGNNWLQEVCSL